MMNKNKVEVKRIDFGGRVSGEVLTLLGYAAQQSLHEKFEQLEIEHAKLALCGETEKALEIIEGYMNEPFFDGSFSGKKESEKRFDIEAWVDGLRRHIILNFDDKAISDLTESLASLRGSCRPIDKTAIQDWLRAWGRAVRAKAATKTKEWVKKYIDELYWEIVDCGLDLKIRTSIICIFIGIELLKEVLWEEQGVSLFERVGKTFGEYKDWIIETQLTVQ